MIIIIYQKECEVLKNYSLLLLLLCPVLLFSGCAGQNETPEEPLETVIMYQALPLPDLLVSIPENYQTTSSQAYKEYYICEDASIIITEDTRESYYPSAYDYSVNALKEYRNLVPSLEFVGNEAMETKSRYTIQTLEFDYTIGEGEEAARLSCLAGYLTDGKSMYIITCKCNSDTYQKHREEFVQTMQSAAIAR